MCTRAEDSTVAGLRAVDAGDDHLGIALGAALLDLPPAFLGRPPARRVDRIRAALRCRCRRAPPRTQRSTPLRLVLPQEGRRDDLGREQRSLLRIGDLQSRAGGIGRGGGGDDRLRAGRAIARREQQARDASSDRNGGGDARPTMSRGITGFLRRCGAPRGSIATASALAEQLGPAQRGLDAARTGSRRSRAGGAPRAAPAHRSGASDT